MYKYILVVFIGKVKLEVLMKDGLWLKKIFFYLGRLLFFIGFVVLEKYIWYDRGRRGYEVS